MKYRQPLAVLTLFVSESNSRTLERFCKSIDPDKLVVEETDLLSCNHIPLRNEKKIVFNSDVMKRAIQLALKASETDFAVLIQGETGAGKELIAELIHQFSHRRDKPFIRVNCAAIPENLLESELFGYEPGSFTGASREGKRGKFELANGGTIFLDEIGDMPFGMQAKLLRVLQDGEVTRIGGYRPIHVNVRIIAATNKNLYQMVKNGQFRDDLFYRLNVVPIYVPPLRERKEEIPIIAKHFLGSLDYYSNLDGLLNHRLIQLLEKYHWPGNLRELQNVIKYISLLGDQLDNRNLENQIRQYLQYGNEIKDRSVNIKAGVKLEDLLKDVEKKAILYALEDNHFNKSKAAEALGISRQALYSKAKEHNIHL